MNSALIALVLALVLLRGIIIVPTVARAGRRVRA